MFEVLFSVLVLVAIGGWYSHRRLRQIDRRESYREDFFDAAKVLIQRDDTPESVLSLVTFLANHLDSWTAPYKMLFFLVHGDVRRSAHKPSEKAQQLNEDIAAMDDTLKEQFGKAVAAGSMAISLNSLFTGWLLRRIALYQVGKRNKRHYDGADDAGTIVTGWACT